MNNLKGIYLSDIGLEYKLAIELENLRFCEIIIHKTDNINTVSNLLRHLARLLEFEIEEMKEKEL
jgi:hypothetical protein